VPRRAALVALWAVFAGASVSVGFGAASLVSDPFTDLRTTSDVTGASGAGDAPFSEATGSPDGQATVTPTPSTTGGHTRTPTPTSSRATHSSGPTTSPSTAAPAATVKGGISTRAGYVSGTCRAGLVTVGAAPAVYWKVDSMTRGWVHTARVRLEPAQDASGERFEVTATCSGGKPGFTPVYHPGGGGGGDDGGGGGDDGGGGGDDGGGGGGDDSSGSSGSGDG
jgi:hypothetical protein